VTYRGLVIHRTARELRSSALDNSATMSCDRVYELAASVALDAAEVSDHKEVDRHVAACAGCAELVRELRETTALLGAAVAQVDAPPRLRERVLEAARHSRGLRAGVGGGEMVLTGLVRGRRRSPDDRDGQRGPQLL
jgi:hypothetical protein